MATERVHVLYEHDPADLHDIQLAVVAGHVVPGEADWQSAYRDTIAGQRCVWAVVEVPARPVVWLKDRSGPRRVVRWRPPAR